ncbi:MAG: methylamine utilization protein [Proteobacteria bacterium]|nr:methylamine utilization protein [Pseudomonadota bacterium]
MTRTVSPLTSWRCLHGVLLGLTCLAGLLSSTCALAGDVRVEVIGRDGAPVSGVAIVLEMPAGMAHGSVHHTARMDQQNRRFIPEVLVVESGTSVEFPNSDSVSHQVYSFSSPRRFQLPLYKGVTRGPVTFGQPGLVVLGCNIHDEMVGYILVTDSPFHGATDASGTAHISAVTAGTYRVSAWGPRINDGGGTLAATLAVSGDAPQSLTLRLHEPLRRNPSPRPGRVDWDGY